MRKYCVYLTTYMGNKLPPFYIGSSLVEKIENNYHGSVSSKKYKEIWKAELETNPSLFKTKIISLHDSKQGALEKEEKLQRCLNVIRSPLYVNLCFANAGFDSTLPEIAKAISESRRGKLGRKWTAKQKDKASKQRLGKKLSKRHRENISISIKTSEKCRESAINNLPKDVSGDKNGMYGRSHSKDSMDKLRETRALKSKEDNIKSYSRKKSEEEINKLKETIKSRHVIRVSRIYDRKDMDYGNFCKWLSTV